MYCILEMDEHEHKRLILPFKAQPFFFFFKEMTLLNVSQTIKNIKSLEL